MAKKIRFPLIMNQGIEVRTIEELQTSFSLDRVKDYIADGTMDTWLRDRYMDELADALCSLNAKDNNYNHDICKLFDVECPDPEYEKERQRKLDLLKQYGINHYDDVAMQFAFDQDDLYDLLDAGVDRIYLYGDKFSIPVNKTNIHYYGISNGSKVPIASIFSKEVIDFTERKIYFHDVKFDEKYEALIDASTKEQVSLQSVTVKQSISAPETSPVQQPVSPQSFSIPQETAKLIPLTPKLREEVDDFKKIMKNNLDSFESSCKDYLEEIDDLFEEYEDRIETDIEYDLDFDEYNTKEEAITHAKKKLTTKYLTFCKDWGLEALNMYNEICDLIVDEIELNLDSFIDEILYSYQDFIEFECEKETASYIKQKGHDLFCEDALKKIYSDLKYKDALSKARREKLLITDTKFNAKLNEYINLCNIHYDGDVYMLELDEGIDQISDDFNSIAYDNRQLLEEQIKKLTEKVISDYCKKMNARIILF